MNKAFVREPDSQAEYCPRCGSQGEAVTRETLRCYLAAADLEQLADPANFCPSPQCDVAYFDMFERVVTKDRLTHPAYLKNPAAPLCPCFGLTEEDIETQRGRRRGDADQGGLGKGPLVGRALRPVGGQRSQLRFLCATLLHAMPAARESRSLIRKTNISKHEIRSTKS